ncbi:DUF4262 domain-containing protein [Streptomyces sp. HUAS MG91]|uniref:DUF4262 domain-containing protein n=1 Tax=Streptomyces tabacisoli TaxID=3156398 RepID=A0AAU8IKM2_9ACTN
MTDDPFQCRCVLCHDYGDRDEADRSHPDVVDGHRVALRQVDRGWYRTFFGQAIGFYRRPPLPVLQVTWPDAEGRFYCDEQADERHRESQPQLWLPPSDHPVGIWTTEL